MNREIFMKNRLTLICGSLFIIFSCFFLPQVVVIFGSVVLVQIVRAHRFVVKQDAVFPVAKPQAIVIKDHDVLRVYAKESNS